MNDVETLIATLPLAAVAALLIERHDRYAELAVSVGTAPTERPPARGTARPGREMFEALASGWTERAIATLADRAIQWFGGAYARDSIIAETWQAWDRALAIYDPSCGRVFQSVAWGVMRRRARQAPRGRYCGRPTWRKGQSRRKRR